MHGIHFNERNFLINEAQKRLIVTSCTPQTLLKKIIDKGKLGAYPIPAFVLSALLRSSYDKDKFEQYKAVTLISIARLSFIGGNYPKINKISNEIRLFAKGSREFLAGHLPDIFQYAFPELVNELGKLTSETTTIRSTKVIKHLKHYEVPYRSTLEGKRGYTRSVTTKQFLQAGTLTVSPRQYLNDEGDSLIEIKQLHFVSRNNETWQEEDGLGNDNRSLTIVTSPSSVNKDYSLEVVNQ